MIKYHRNWRTVCALEDEDLKYLITWAEDDQVISGLNKGFPQLFSDRETPILIPVSAMRKKAIEQFLFHGRSYGAETLDHLAFAEWFQWNVRDHRFPKAYIFADEGHENDNPVPPEVLIQLNGKKFKAGEPVHITYEDEDCLVVYVLDTGWTDMKDGWKFEVGLKKTYFGIHLVPAKYIDLNA